jgi:hypothetical protein
MTEKKSFWNKIKGLKKEVKTDTKVDKQLLPRLQFMGYLLLFFSVCAFAYAIMEEIGLINDTSLSEELIASSGISLPDIEPPIVVDIRIFNAYLAGTSFILVGVTSLIYVWKKQKRLGLDKTQGK